MTIEKNNKIWVGINRRGYFLNCMNNNYKYKNKIESYSKENLQGGNFYELIGTLLNTSNDFYGKGIKLKFERNPKVKIQKEEKSTIEKLVKRLETDAKEINGLKYSLKAIIELSKTANEESISNNRASFILK